MLRNKLHFADILSDKSKAYIIVLGLALVLLLGFIDSLIDYRVSFSIFYVLPVVLVTWYTGVRTGILFSIISSLMWLVAAYVSRNHQLPHAILFWNSAVRLGFFMIITSVLYYFKSERDNARIDYLTGIPNRRHFEDMLFLESQRSLRYDHPLTLVFMDIDNFKMINDSRGHREGDRLLSDISTIMHKAIRTNDVIARLGGDEFAFILIETDEKDAKMFVQKIQYELVMAMEAKTWPVTFSFGIVTFYNLKKTVGEMIHIADTCMYYSKKAGKNKLSFKVIR